MIYTDKVLFSASGALQGLPYERAKRAPESAEASWGTWTAKVAEFHVLHNSSGKGQGPY